MEPKTWAKLFLLLGSVLVFVGFAVNQQQNKKPDGRCTVSLWNWATIAIGCGMVMFGSLKIKKVKTMDNFDFSAQ